MLPLVLQENRALLFMWSSCEPSVASNIFFPAVHRESSVNLFFSLLPFRGACIGSLCTCDSPGSDLRPVGQYVCCTSAQWPWQHGYYRNTFLSLCAQTSSDILSLAPRVPYPVLQGTGAAIRVGEAPGARQRVVKMHQRKQPWHFQWFDSWWVFVLRDWIIMYSTKSASTVWFLSLFSIISKAHSQGRGHTSSKHLVKTIQIALSFLLNRSARSF